MTETTLSKTPKYKQGSVPELLVIALPMMASSACDTVMTFTDRLFLSKLGTSQMNASLGGGLMAFMLSTFFIGLIGYSTALIGQYYGSGQKRKCSVVVTQSAIVAFIAYPLILLLSPLVSTSFRASGIAPEQLGPQTVFFKILVYGSIVGLLRGVFSCFFSGIGRTKTVMIASATAMLVNVGASYTLIFGHLGFPALGIAGAGYGTVFGGTCGLLVLICAYFFGNKHKEFGIKSSVKFDFDVMRKLLRFGSPAGLEFLLSFAAFGAMITLFQSQGQTVATAATVTFNWDMVAFVPLIGIEIAVTSMVGRYMGSRQPDIAHCVTMSGLKIGVIYSGIMLVLFAAFPLMLINIFKPDVHDSVFIASLPLTVFMVRMMSVYVLLETLMVALCGALRGAGDTLWAMCMNVSLHWLLVAVLFVTFKILHLSAEAAWVIMIVWFMLLAGVFYQRYRGGKWREIELIRHTDVPEEAAGAPAISHNTDHCPRQS